MPQTLTHHLIQIDWNNLGEMQRALNALIHKIDVSYAMDVDVRVVAQSENTEGIIFTVAVSGVGE